MLALVLAQTGEAQRYAIGGWGAPLGIVWRIDGLAVWMLLTAVPCWAAVIVYALRHFDREHGPATEFWPLAWLLLTGLNALFLSADLFHAYVALELIGVSAVALVALARQTAALTAAMRYLLVTFLASLSYLLGVALIYHGTGTLDMQAAGAQLTAGPAAWLATGLVASAMAMKSALFPLHFWLPPAHSTAPTPVSALLSALVVEAPVYLLIRIWIDVVPGAPAVLGQALAALGAAAVLWGSLMALRQTRLKLLVAYSTVAQLGYLFLPFAFTTPQATAAAWRGAVYLILCHALAKATAFLAAGNLHRFGGHDRIAEIHYAVQRLPVTLAAFAIAGVTLMGLPPSGGFVAKWLLLEAAVSEERWWIVLVLLVGGLLAAGYVFKVVGLAFTEGQRERSAERPSALLEWTPLALALATLLLAFGGPWLFPLLDVGAPFGAAQPGAAP